MELLKYPRALVCAGKMGSDTYSYDRRIENVYLRGGDTVVLSLCNYDGSGLLKYFEKRGN